MRQRILKQKWGTKPKAISMNHIKFTQNLSVPDLCIFRIDFLEFFKYIFRFLNQYENANKVGTVTIVLRQCEWFCAYLLLLVVHYVVNEKREK